MIEDGNKPDAQPADLGKPTVKRAPKPKSKAKPAGKRPKRTPVEEVARDAADSGDLNPRERLFVLEYIVSRNASEAARQAGYSVKTAGVIGHELLKKPKIARALKEATRRIEREAEVDAVWVVRVLREVVERSLQRKPVMVFNPVERCMEQKIDEETGLGVWEYDSMGVNKAAETIGKHLGMFDKDGSGGGDGNRMAGAVIIVNPPKPVEKPVAKKPVADASA